MVKECKYCNKIKSLSDFRKDKYQKDGHRNKCIDCDNEYDRKRYQAKKNGTFVSSRKRFNEVLTEHDTWIELDASTLKHPNSILLIDKEDWEIFGKYPYGRWSATEKHKGSVYIRGYNYELKKSEWLHRLLCPQWDMIDHIDRNPFNNRKSNLRHTTYVENNKNRVFKKRKKKK